MNNNVAQNVQPYGMNATVRMQQVVDAFSDLDSSIFPRLDEHCSNTQMMMWLGLITNDCFRYGACSKEVQAARLGTDPSSTGYFYAHRWLRRHLVLTEDGQDCPRRPRYRLTRQLCHRHLDPVYHFGPIVRAVVVTQLNALGAQSIPPPALPGLVAAVGGMLPAGMGQVVNPGPPLPPLANAAVVPGVFGPVAVPVGQINPVPQNVAPVGGGPIPLIGVGQVAAVSGVGGPLVVPMPVNPPALGMVAAAPVFNPVALVPPPAAAVVADGVGNGATNSTPSRWSNFFNMVTPRRG
jgi:hypothetical protein